MLGVAAILLVIGVAYRLGEEDPRVSTLPDEALRAAPFAPPAETSIPAGPQGDAIRRGEQILVATAAHAGRYVGNGLVCSNCHLNRGRQANAAPMWAAWVGYPAYRAKNGRINTVEDRIRDCFNYSMNAPASAAGGPPPLGDDIYRDLEAYFAWLATDAPTGRSMEGRGYAKLASTALGYSPIRGASVYAQHCAACHGADGRGQPRPGGGYAIPPLWGQRSFNWGAGMANVASAGGFIKENMPLGQGGTLTGQQAWDVAAFVDSHERAPDPRQTGSVADARKRFHSQGDYYGQTVDGNVLGDGRVTKKR